MTQKKMKMICNNNNSGYFLTCLLLCLNMISLGYCLEYGYYHSAILNAFAAGWLFYAVLD
jgi:hypothetical protein